VDDDENIGAAAVNSGKGTRFEIIVPEDEYQFSPA